METAPCPPYWGECRCTRLTKGLEGERDKMPFYLEQDIEAGKSNNVHGR